MKDAEGLFSVIRQFHEQEKLVAAICAGPYALAKAGLFKRKLVYSNYGL